MATLTLQAVSKKFDENLVVNHVDLEVRDKEFVVLLGPSGCGKSTILRMIAGLEKVTTGNVVLDGTVINNVPPQKRDMAMVFQNYALYAHLKVFDNLGFSLRMHHTPPAEIQKRVSAVAEMLHIDHLLDRLPRQLSGGERQRVALGRAIVREPRLFLMDEPLSNLDALLRIQTRVEILQLCRRIGATVLYVTHDQTEAMTMGERIVLLKDGVVQQVDTPEGIYGHPSNRFVGMFVGSPPMNFIEDVTMVQEGDSLLARSAQFKIDLTHLKHRLSSAGAAEQASRSVVLGFRPDAVTLVADSRAAEGIPAMVEVVEVLGREALVYCNTGAQLVCSVVSPENAPGIGERLVLEIRPGKTHVFDSLSGKNLIDLVSMN